MVSEELIKMLVCPETRQPVAPAPAQVLERLNQQIQQGTLRDVGGELIEQPIAAGLIREDGQVLYPVLDDIPRMLIERGIRSTPGEAGGP